MRRLSERKKRTQKTGSCSGCSASLSAKIETTEAAQAEESEAREVMRTRLAELELEALREFKKSVDNAVTVAFLSMTDDLGATEPREAIEHIRREFRDAELKFQQRIRVFNSGSN